MVICTEYSIIKSNKIMKRIITVCIISLLIISPNFVSADSVSDLQAQIANLMAQIQQLQLKLAQMQGQSTTAWCHTFNTDIGVGSTGSEVYALSLALQKEGINLGKFDSYDETAASAVSTFQEKYRSEVLTRAGLSSPTGYVGARTRAKLNLLYGCGSTNVILPNPVTPSPVACTSDAKLCPDGKTYVSRIAPSCQFTACPTESWDVAGSVQVGYPNGGEEFLSEKGGFIAKWKANQQPVNVYFVYNDSSNNIAQTLGTNISGESLTVNVNADLLQKDVNRFKLKVCLYAKSSVCDMSDSSFSFVSSINPPQILYPLGGEMFSGGTTVYVSWNPVTYSGTFDVSIIGINSGNSYIISQSVPVQATDKQSISWTPTAGMYEKDTQFIVQVCRTGTTLCSKSNSFTINF